MIYKKTIMLHIIINYSYNVFYNNYKMFLFHIKDSLEIISKFIAYYNKMKFLYFTLHLYY